MQVSYWERGFQTLEYNPFTHMWSLGALLGTRGTPPPHTWSLGVLLRTCEIQHPRRRRGAVLLSFPTDCRTCVRTTRLPCECARFVVAVGTEAATCGLRHDLPRSLCLPLGVEAASCILLAPLALLAADARRNPL